LLLFFPPEKALLLSSCHSFRSRLCMWKKTCDICLFEYSLLYLIWLSQVASNFLKNDITSFLFIAEKYSIVNTFQIFFFNCCAGAFTKILNLSNISYLNSPPPSFL
jgi:hypothetical protein